LSGEFLRLSAEDLSLRRNFLGFRREFLSFFTDFIISGERFDRPAEVFTFRRILCQSGDVNKTKAPYKGASSLEVNGYLDGGVCVLVADGRFL